MLIPAGEAARRIDLLALLSSVMHHLPVEATAVTLQRAEAGRSEMIDAQRAIVDARADLRGAHGLDLRGDRFVGDLRAWLSEVAVQPDPALVVLGLPNVPAEIAASLGGDLAPQFAAGARTPVLLAINAAP